MTCTDSFSKWPEAKPLKDKTAIGVADFLYELLTRYGVAEVIISDQGREFVNQINEELFRLTGTDHRISSAYHPQTNGLDERMNQTIKTSLVKYVNENQTDWDVHVSSVLFAYRTSVHDSTKYSPYELMFGRKPVLPVELQIPPFSSTSDDDSTAGAGHVQFENKVRVMKEIRQKVNAKALKNISKAQQRMKANYDAKHQAPSFKSGDEVLLKSVRNDSRKGGKLECTWTGPYVISNCLAKGLYKLVKGGKELKKSYNGVRLKKYAKPSKVNDAAGSRSKDTVNPNVWLPGLGLTAKDKKTLQNNSKLDDKVINAAQTVLKQQFPGISGWQDTILSQTSFESIPVDSVQTDPP
jgi:hypothetical protein